MSNILLLEDDLSLINGLSFAFKKQGFELVVARTLKEADSLWTDGKYDLLVFLSVFAFVLIALLLHVLYYPIVPAYN